VWGKIKLFLEKYWGIVLSVFGFAVGFVISRKQPVSKLDGHCAIGGTND
jgi:hypothetical protein